MGWEMGVESNMSGLKHERECVSRCRVSERAREIQKKGDRERGRKREGDRERERERQRVGAKEGWRMRGRKRGQESRLERTRSGGLYEEFEHEPGS